MSLRYCFGRVLAFNKSHQCLHNFFNVWPEYYQKHEELAVFANSYNFLGFTSLLEVAFQLLSSCSATSSLRSTSLLKTGNPRAQQQQQLQVPFCTTFKKDSRAAQVSGHWLALGPENWQRWPKVTFALVVHLARRTNRCT